VCKMSVSNLQLNWPLLHPTMFSQCRSLLCESLYTHRNFERSLSTSTPHTRRDEQSKECQKAHWKGLHKTTCSAQATIRDNLKETPEEKEWSKKVTRWINAWSRAIFWCAPTALDLGDHEWGHHDTHRYALLRCSSLSFLTQFRREVSSCVWNPPVLARTVDCFGSGNANPS